MINNLLLVLAFTVSAVACQPAATKVYDSESSRHQGEDARARAEILCQRLSEMKTMPFKGEPIEDEVYNGLAALKDAAIPCLIGKITDSLECPTPVRRPCTLTLELGTQPSLSCLI